MLEVELLDGFVPASSDVIIAVAAGSISGRFANARTRLQLEHGAFDVTYTATTVALYNFDPSALPTPEATPSATPLIPACTGDCNADGRVTVDEIVRGVNIALGSIDIDTCPRFDVTADGAVTVDEVVSAVAAALNGCPAG